VKLQLRWWRKVSRYAIPKFVRAEVPLTNVHGSGDPIGRLKAYHYDTSSGW